MFKHEKVLWITRTAVLIAITVVLQALTLQLGNQFITGSIVNLMLILAVMTCGLATGLTVSAVTPVLPTLLGFGPLWPIVPFIALGNMALVTLWHFIGNRNIGNNIYIAYIMALVAGAVAKFLVLFFGVSRLAVPVLLSLPEPQATVISGLFSYPQLITASIGGVCAIILLPLLLKAIKQRNS
jgi:uncharacterized membrane protein